MRPITLFEYSYSEKREGLLSNDLKRIYEINRRLRRKFKKDVINVLYEDRLKTYNYVGVIQLGRKRIQVLPKIYKDDRDKEKARKALRNLIYMLEYTRQLPIGKISKSVFRRYDDFLEVYIRIFLDELESTLRSQIFREYVVIEDNLSFLRGRILMHQHIRENLSKNNKMRIYCEFDELTEDNLLNQTIKYTLRLLRIVSLSPFNIDRINQLLFLFDGISDRIIMPHDLEKIHFTRLNETFKPVIETCFLIINNLSADLSSGTTKHWALIFDMNKLFEEFVARFIIKHKKWLGLENYNIKAQGYLKMDEDKKVTLDEDKKVTLKPDLLVYRDPSDTGEERSIELILDTKYKQLKSEKDISNEDIYQMLAYGIGGECSKTVLLYPRTADSKKDMSTLSYTIPLYRRSCDHRLPKKIDIYVETLNIMYDDLREADNEMRKELKEKVFSLLK